MAEELEVSLRTVYRDINSLIGQGVPIRGEAGIGYVLGEGYDMPPLMFTADELEAVMLGLRWVTRRGDVQLTRAARDSVAKIGAVLPEGLRPFLFDASLVVAPRDGRTVDTVDVAALRSAIRESRKVSIQYRDEIDRYTERTIWPIGIVYYEATRNIIAWCELRTAFRHFRTDRIGQVDILKDRYPKRRKALLKEWQEELRADMEKPDLDVFL